MEQEFSQTIILDKITKSYGKRTILSNLSLEIGKGEIFGLLGPSGCGKTTTVKIMTGILKSDSGSVTILNTLMPNRKILGKIGYMAQTAALYPTLSGYENLKFFGSLYGLKNETLKKRINEVAELVGLSTELKKLVGAYSGGMKQRLSLAITLLASPEILILDEPTVGIDPLLRQRIWDALFTLREQGITIILTTHVMDEVAHCNRIAMMQEGQLLIVGTPEQILHDSECETLEQAFIQYEQKGIQL